MKKTCTSILMVIALGSISFLQKGIAQTVLLYQNSFELPLMAPAANCGPDLDATFVNTLWGGTGTGTGGGGFFQQEFTVETILINGPNNQFTDSSGLGGNYCLSLLTNIQNDRLALTLNSQMLPFVNISFLISPIDLPACGGPFGLDTAIMYVKVFDSPGGSFSFPSPGSQLDEDTLIGSLPGTTPFTFNWTQINTSLDISNSVDGNITLVFDLIKSAYAAIDSIVITSSVTPLSVQEQFEAISIVASPNPFSNELEIIGTGASGQLTIFDTLGKVVYYQKTFSSNTKITTQDLLPGIYFINYFEKNKSAHIKLLKF